MKGRAALLAFHKKEEKISIFITYIRLSQNCPNLNKNNSIILLAVVTVFDVATSFFNPFKFDFNDIQLYSCF